MRPLYLWNVLRSSERCSCLLLLETQLIAPGALARRVRWVTGTLPHQRMRLKVWLAAAAGGVVGRAASVGALESEEVFRYAALKMCSTRNIDDSVCGRARERVVALRVLRMMACVWPACSR